MRTDIGLHQLLDTSEAFEEWLNAQDPQRVIYTKGYTACNCPIATFLKDKLEIDPEKDPQPVVKSYRVGVQPAWIEHPASWINLFILGIDTQYGPGARKEEALTVLTYNKKLLAEGKGNDSYLI